MLAKAAKPVARYNRTAIALHWVVAAFVFINIIVGLTGANTENKHEAQRFIDLHKSIGITIFGLVLLRLLWRLAHRPPPLPRAYSRLERLAAHAAHGALYAVMLLLPLTGYIHDSAWKLAASHPMHFFGLLYVPRIGAIEALGPVTKEHVHDVFGAAHLASGYVLYGLLVLHLLGVLKHHAIDHEEELQRMWPVTFERPTGPE